MSARVSQWKKWLRPGRLVPLVTAAAAMAVGLLLVSGKLPDAQVEGIIVIILGVIAFDALTERLTVLEKIEGRLEGLSGGGSLRGRERLQHPKLWISRAGAIDVAGISAISLTTVYGSFLEEQVREGCRFRFLLLDPASDAVATWKSMVRETDAVEEDIQRSLQHLGSLRARAASPDQVEVRLARVFPPFSLFAVEPARKRGTMIVELHAHRAAVDQRPHLHLVRQQDEVWFSFFLTQFEALWEEAEPWQG